MIYDDRINTLGEGIIWHPSQLRPFWFDILGRKLRSVDGNGPREWDFPGMVSAMGAVGYYISIVAAEDGVYLMSLETGETELLVPIEADRPDMRSNDGKVDRQGGFWIGTMAKAGDRQGKGAIYRLYKGDTRKIYDGVSIPNAICFAPDGRTGYFADTMAQTVWKVALDEAGWPCAEREVFLDFTGTEIYPDGATIDAAGNFWNAQWGSARVACYSAAGEFLREIKVDAPHTSCCAFGGPGMATLYVTTALEDMSPEALAQYPDAGKVFAFEGVGEGLDEPKFLP
ncbi:SMP-30/gluconolactonase/LRE family protein [Rhodobacter sp. KR11]|uniref:SMP-30/gluconolactonase/LRE family protein n=1 Tax=Rhodobacter sp. KR11 TaxID=2974588 RepID=UPI0022235710|nr:SMP-30/gluconolactonase/LRE family protein [Rhodobacter sp. KR11]MCW1919307.1 SMP-30/gluconolactonase/LRE family protein [Rhodobacter sp. KR11]